MISFMASLFFTCATQYLNSPYKWGANGPFEFDCSGLVVKSWNDYNRISGKDYIIPDMSSQGIYNYLIKSGKQCEPPSEGCLLFYGKSIDKISHIAIHGPQNMIIEAGGAARETFSMDSDQLRAHCSKKDARVRLRNFGHRRDLVASIRIDVK